MDFDTKEIAVKKAMGIIKHIGYPNELANVTKLEEFYKDLELEGDNLLLDKSKIEIFNTNNKFGKLRETFNKSDWTTHSNSAEVNARSIDEENCIGN